MNHGTETDYRKRLFRVLRHIAEHLDQDLGLEELAGLAHFSPYHFHRIFSGMIGESLKSYVRRLRLERAALRLTYNEGSVTEIALDAGYETPDSFARAFKTRFSMSPSQYRARTREQRNVARPGGSDPALVILFTDKGENAMDVSIEKFGPVKVASVRHVGPYYKCEEAWGKLCAWAGPKGLLGPQSVYIGECHDDPEVTDPEKIRYDACITVPDGVEGEGEVLVRELPGAEYAVYEHKGPYEKLSESYKALCGQWFPTSGKEISHKASLEIYLTDPETTPPEELRTKIMIPVEPA